MKRTRTVVLSSLVAAGLVTMIVGTAAQDQPPAPPAAGRGNFLNNFTGNITVGNTKDMSSSRIKFDAGARTNWHLHSAPQLLLVEEGRGRLQELGESIKDVPAGQPVLTKANGGAAGAAELSQDSAVLKQIRITNPK